MGLCGYGKIIDEYVPAFKEFLFDRDYEKLSETGQDFLLRILMILGKIH